MSQEYYKVLIRLYNIRSKVNIRSRQRRRKGLILAGEQSLMMSCKAVLQYKIIAVWSKGMYKVRAKIIKGSAGMFLLCLQPAVQYWQSLSFEVLLEVYCSLPIAIGF